LLQRCQRGATCHQANGGTLGRQAGTDPAADGASAIDADALKIFIRHFGPQAAWLLVFQLFIQ
jgi:hypothetical protein